MKHTPIRNIVLALCAAAAGLASHAQPLRFSGAEWQDPGVGSAGTAPLRTEFISFDTRENSEKGDLSKNPFYMPFDADAIRSATSGSEVSFDIPYSWLDREVFLHIAGIDPYYVKINGRTIGYAEDMRTPAEFNISQWLTDGKNTLTLDPRSEATGKALEWHRARALPTEMFIYSQPKLRVEDFTIKAGPDSTGKYCILEIAVAVANSYNSEETFRLGYDLYTPDGKKLVYYDMKEITLQGPGVDTIRFREPVYLNMQKDLWSAENPALYRFTFNISYDKRWTEYIPVRVGFGETTFRDGAIYRNGKAIEHHSEKQFPLKIDANFNSSQYPDLEKQLRELKKQGYNTIWPYYPQPIRFYDLCEEIGLYVIEQVNINSSDMDGDRTVGGAYSNAPQWLGTFMDRTMAAYTRVTNRPCIIAWSLGGKVGNGYNMYKTYQWLKAQGDTRPIIFNDAQGEWNTDMPPFTDLLINIDPTVVN